MDPQRAKAKNTLLQSIFSLDVVKSLKEFLCINFVAKKTAKIIPTNGNNIKKRFRLGSNTLIIAAISLDAIFAINSSSPNALDVIIKP